MAVIPNAEHAATILREAARNAESLQAASDRFGTFLVHVFDASPEATTDIDVEYYTGIADRDNHGWMFDAARALPAVKVGNGYYSLFQTYNSRKGKQLKQPGNGTDLTFYETKPEGDDLWRAISLTLGGAHRVRAGLTPENHRGRLWTPTGAPVSQAEIGNQIALTNAILTGSGLESYIEEGITISQESPVASGR